jgi:hypothetical protein
MWQQGKEHFIEVYDCEVLNVIKKGLSSHGYAECGKCGALKVDAMPLAKFLHSRNDISLSEGDDASDILSKMTEDGPAWDTDLDWDKWNKENRHRLCGFIESDREIYVASPEVVLYCDKECACLKTWV